MISSPLHLVVMLAVMIEVMAAGAGTQPGVAPSLRLRGLGNPSPLRTDAIVGPKDSLIG